jgi:hypothetical protein
MINKKHCSQIHRTPLTLNIIKEIELNKLASLSTLFIKFISSVNSEYRLMLMLNVNVIVNVNIIAILL